jgi:RNA polymerase sigma factor (sigma-70 family)
MKARDGDHVNQEEMTRFFSRYQGAVLRFFRTAVRNQDVAEDLTQDFALKFIRGGFQAVHPEGGRFRDFLRVALANQLRDHYRQQLRRRDRDKYSQQLVEQVVENEPAEDFDTNWRDELLAQTWSDLERHQQSTGQKYYTALRLKAESNGVVGSDLVRLFSDRSSTATTETAFRKLLQRARRQFGELLLKNVAETLAVPTRDELMRELADLKLLIYCKDLLSAD